MQNPEEVRELAWVRHVVLSGKAREIRESSHLTTGEAATAVQVTPVTVWRWENNRRAPRGEVALRYGRFLRSLVAAQRELA